MNLGPLDRRIRVEQCTVGKDATYGAPTQTWSTFATLWASIEEDAGADDERSDKGLRIATRKARVTTRYVAGLTSAMRVVYLDRDNRVMQILSQPAELGRKDGLTFRVADFTTSGTAA